MTARGSARSEAQTDSTWPGIYRPRVAAPAAEAADPDATIAPPAAARGERAAQASRFFGRGQRTQTRGIQAQGSRARHHQASGGQGSPGQPQGSQAPGNQAQGNEPGGQPGSHDGALGTASRPRQAVLGGGSSRPGLRAWQAWRGDRRTVIAGAVVVAVLIGAAVYLTLGSNKAAPAAGNAAAAKVHAKATVRMLLAATPAQGPISRGR